jgi:hypothetical protein
MGIRAARIFHTLQCTQRPGASICGKAGEKGFSFNHAGLDLAALRRRRTVAGASLVADVACPGQGRQLRLVDIGRGQKQQVGQVVRTPFLVFTGLGQSDKRSVLSFA